MASTERMQSREKRISTNGECQPRLATLGSPFQRKGLEWGGCRFLRIVISSEVEKSSLQTEERCFASIFIKAMPESGIQVMGHQS